MNRIKNAINLLQDGIDVGDAPEAKIMQEAIDILSEPGSKPEPTEFTKKIRDEAGILQLYAAANDKRGAFRFKDILEACDIIDRLAAELAEVRKKPAPGEFAKDIHKLIAGYKQGCILDIKYALASLDNAAKEIDRLTAELATLKELETKAIDGCIRYREELKTKDEEIARQKNALAIATGYVREESTRTTDGQLYDIEQALKENDEKNATRKTAKVF